MEKKKFDFYQDVKVTVWQRQHFTIEAETEEEAREIAKRYTQFDVSFEDDVDVNEVEWLHDSEELIIPEENDGCATIEVYEREGKYKGTLIADNSIENFKPTDNDMLHETIADIAFNMGWEHFDDIDSREMVRCIIQWAKEFEKAHEKTDWTSKADYLEEIDEFSSTKISEYLLGKK